MTHWFYMCHFYQFIHTQTITTATLNTVKWENYIIFTKYKFIFKFNMMFQFPESDKFFFLSLFRCQIHNTFEKIMLFAFTVFIFSLPCLCDAFHLIYNNPNNNVCDEKGKSKIQYSKESVAWHRWYKYCCFNK